MATVDSQGNVIAVQEGNAQITAEVDGITAVCSINVIPVNFEQNSEYLSFTGIDSDSSISFTTSLNSVKLEYSYDTLNWYPWDKYFTISFTLREDGEASPILNLK